jgi:hypothetical protein
MEHRGLSNQWSTERHKLLVLVDGWALRHVIGKSAIQSL